MKEENKNPATQQKSLRSFFDLHQLMGKNEIILTYAGDFSQELTKTLLAFTERKFTADQTEDIVRRKIFNIMVEMLQNISKNAIDKDHFFTINSPMFLLGETEDSYFMITSNKVNSVDIDKIGLRIDEVNSLDADGLKQLYKDVRLKGKFSDIGGAGIGIIDMARKSGNKLIYSFENVNTAFSLFNLLIKVSKNYN